MQHIFIQGDDALKAFPFENSDQGFINFLEEYGIELAENVTLSATRDGFACDSASKVSIQSMIEQHGERYRLIGELVGGKVHGSLSRAGKVKGQTPKVEKAEKKKKLTGRAKRRQQYIKRFKRSVPDARGKRRR